MILKRFSCPGYALPDADPLDDIEEEVAQLVRHGGTKIWCERCKVEQDPSTKHCVYCDRCIRGWDHHCLWIGVCVGVENARFFLAYLGTQTLCTILALDLLLMSKADLADPRRFAAWIVATLFLLLSAVLIGGLFAWHSFCALTGCTTRDIIKGNIGNHREEEVRDELKGLGTCTRCFWSLEGFLKGRPTRGINGAIKRRGRLTGAQHKCLHAMDSVCDNQFYSCF